MAGVAIFGSTFSCGAKAKELSLKCDVGGGDGPTAFHHTLSRTALALGAGGGVSLGAGGCAAALRAGREPLQRRPAGGTPQTLQT